MGMVEMLRVLVVIGALPVLVCSNPKKTTDKCRWLFLACISSYFALRTAACAAAKRAIGTRYGEHDTYVNPTR